MTHDGLWLSAVLAFIACQPNSLVKINRITNAEVRSVSQHSRKPHVASSYSSLIFIPNDFNRVSNSCALCPTQSSVVFGNFGCPSPVS